VRCASDRNRFGFFQAAKKNLNLGVHPLGPDVRPLCPAREMDELCVSASDLRVHLKDLANTVDPERMPLEKVEQLYRITKGTTESRVERWREKAWLHIKLKTGNFPDEAPWSVPT